MEWLLSANVDSIVLNLINIFLEAVQLCWNQGIFSMYLMQFLWTHS